VTLLDRERESTGAEQGQGGGGWRVEGGCHLFWNGLSQYRGT